MPITNKMSPELHAKMDKAREEYKRGETLHFDTAQDAIAWMNALDVPLDFSKDVEKTIKK